MDPGAGLGGALDVRVRDGLVSEVRAGLAPDGDTVLDVTGRLVRPGLIDRHAHCFAGAADFGPRTDDVARSTGVTRWVDGATPAKAIGREGKLGTLKPGAVADVAVFGLEEGAFDYEDAHGQHITGRHRFVPALTLRAGEVWWRRLAA